MSARLCPDTRFEPITTLFLCVILERTNSVDRPFMRCVPVSKSMSNSIANAVQRKGVREEESWIERR